MIAFWAAAGVFSAVAAIIVLLRAARAATLVEPADPTPVLYRRQMAEIGELAERGLMGQAERQSAEAEAGRRLLNAADHPDLAWSHAAPVRAGMLIAVIAAPVLALVLYLIVGAPGRGDQPFAGRMAHWRSVNPQTLAPQEMAAVLSALTKEHPKDPEGFRFLALAEGASENAPGAVRALRHAVKLAPQRSDLWEMLGEALLMQSGGDINDDATTAFQETLRLDPTSIAARFQLARGQILSGQKAEGLAVWRGLLAEMAPEDPRRPTLLAAIGAAEGLADTPQQPALSGDQMTAVKGMVAGLAARLKTNPDDPDGWVRLVRAYSVLGDTAARDAALKQSRARYAARPDLLDQLNQAANAEPMR